MKAMVLPRTAPIHERPLELREVARPEPGPGEMLVKVHVCAICRTDLHVIEGDLPTKTLPLIPGHQAVGTVERLGSASRRFEGGARVGIAWLRHTCGACKDCRRGNENLCRQSRYTGYHADGGYAEWAIVPEDFAYSVPPVFDDADAAPLLCAGIIGYRALMLSDVQPGERIALYGFGSSAHVVMQIALHRGCEVYVATRGVSHQELARRMGAAWVGGTTDMPPRPVDGAIVFAPAGEIVPAALRAVRSGGTVACAGITMSTIPGMDYENCLFHEKKLRSVEANTRTDGEGLLREAAEIPIRPSVTTFRLEDANAALIALKEDRINGSGVLVID